jgi:hypothetical protein
LGIEFSLDLNRITEIIFSNKIKEVSAILKTWQHRKLTLMGEIYLKLSWIKILLTNPEGKWQKLFLTDLKQYGGERVLYLQKEKLREISVSLKNPFWSDVLLCLSEAKPQTGSSVNDILSLDILNFSSLDDFPYYLLWKNRGVQFVSDLINHENKQFYNLEQIQEKLETNNFPKFYRLIARIPKAFKDCLKENLLDIHFDTTDTFVKKLNLYTEVL